MAENLCSDGGDVVLDVGSHETEVKGSSIKCSENSASCKQIISNNVGLAESSTSGLSKSVVLDPVVSPPNSPAVISTSRPSETSHWGKRKSFGRSFISKPKSRFEEPSVPDVFDEELSPRDSFGNKETSEDDDKEMDDREICEKITHRNSVNRQIIGWLIFVCTLGVLLASLTVQKLENVKFWSLDIWKWCVLVMVIFCGMFVTDWFMSLIISASETNAWLRAKMLYYVHEMNKSVQVFIWFASILLTWLVLFSRRDNDDREVRPTVAKILHYATWTIVSAVIGALFWSLKVLLVKILKYNFYVNAFFDRAHEIIFYQHILRRVLLAGEGEKEISGRQVVDVTKLLKMKKENISGWTKKVLVDAVSTSGPSTLQYCNDVFGERTTDVKITSERQAVAAFKRFIQTVAGPRSPYNEIDHVIEGQNLLQFLSLEEVNHLFTLTNTSGTLEEDMRRSRSLAPYSLRKWMLKAYNGHKRLVHSLSDTKAAIKRLDKIVTSILVVTIILVWLVLVEIATTKVLLFISSQLVLAVFIFGNTCKTVFEAIMFVFVVHPFDVGDRCIVDGMELFVEEMNILTTVFMKLNNDKVYYPNSVLSTLAITNCQTNTDTGDKLEFTIAAFTSMEKLYNLRSKIKCYIECRPAYWNPDHYLSVNEIDNGKLKMALCFDHTLKFHETEEKTKRRSELIIELLKIFDDLDIKCYFMPPQEVLVTSLANN